TAGGAEREPVSAMRRNAPAKLAANGRAVSLKDFERLCAGHSGVWQARARQIIRAGRTNHVDIVIVPAGGGAVTGAFKENLVTFILGRSPPGASVTISLYEAVPVSVSVTLRVERARFEASAVQEAVQTALAEEFSLSRRRLGQPLYVAEILAAAEAVPGVENLVINHFARKPGFPGPLRGAEMAGGLAAIFPGEEQVVQVEDRRDSLVQGEAVCCRDWTTSRPVLAGCSIANCPRSIASSIPATEKSWAPWKPTFMVLVTCWTLSAARPSRPMPTPSRSRSTSFPIASAPLG